MSRHARASCHLVCAETLARFEPSVRFFEQASRSLAVRQMFFERERIPLAPLGRKKVAAIDVDGAGELVDRVEDRMDDIVTQRLSIGCAKRLSSRRLDLVRRSTNTPPEDIVLASGVDADNRPHAMIVRHDRHQGRPYHVQNRQPV